MSLYGPPVLFALLAWWLSTGLIVYLDGLPRRTFRWTLLGATLLCGLGLYGLSASSSDTSVTGAYLAFTSGLLVWGWLEVGFLMGPMTGPRRQPCAPGCRGWRHFGHAIQTILYHELAILAAAAAVLALTWGAANHVGAWTFMVLWFMRQSAKLNVFLGVANLSEEFLPEHLAFLKSFLTRKPMNLLFPFSVTVSTAIVTLVIERAAGAAAFQATGLTFVATMLALAILEHWFLVVPLPSTALWSWSLRSHEPPAHAAQDNPIPAMSGIRP